MKEGHIFTQGEITQDYVKNLQAELSAVPVDAEVIINHIDSPGGDVYAAYTAIHELRKVSKPIHARIEGRCDSAATFIAIAGSSKVEMVEPATFMIHEPFYMDGVPGRIDDLNKAKEELEQIRKAMADAYAKKTGKPVDEMYALMKKQTRMDASMAKAAGFIDTIVIPEPMRIAAQAVETIKNGLNELKNEVMSWFKKLSPVANSDTPKMIDLPIKSGGTLHIASEDENFVGKPATIDGQPATGAYELEDGRTIKCENGVVTEVVAAPAAPPQETAQDKLAKQLAELQNQLNAMKIADDQKAKAEAEQKAKQEAERLAKEKDAKIVALNDEINKLKAQTVGNPDKDDEGTNPHRAPMAYTPSDPRALAIYASRTFLADNFPHFANYYRNGKFSKDGLGNGKYSDGTAFDDYRTGGPKAVSIIETNLGYTYPGVLTTDLFFTPSFNTPALNELFTVDIGAKDSKRYNIIPAFSKVLRPYTGCDQAVTGSSFNITDKRITLKPFQMYEGWCKDDFTNQLTGAFNHLAQEWLKTGTESFDPAGTPIDRIIMQALRDSLRRDIHRRVIFADNGDSDADYNQIDGLFTTLKEQSGAQNYCVYANKTDFSTGALSSGDALAEFESMYENSDALLKEHVWDSGKGALWVTRSLFDNYTASLRGTGAVTEQAFTNQQAGLRGQVMFNGVKVFPMTIWDSLLAEADNPHTSTTRHIAILGSTDNFILGVENTSDLNKIDSWFEKKDNKRYYRSNMTFGILAPILCDLVTISY